MHRDIFHVLSYKFFDHRLLDFKGFFPGRVLTQVVKSRANLTISAGQRFPGATFGDFVERVSIWVVVGLSVELGSEGLARSPLDIFNLGGGLLLFGG